MSIKAFIEFGSKDSPEYWNKQHKDIIQKGIYTSYTLTTASSPPTITVPAFSAMTSQGMTVINDADVILTLADDGVNCVYLRAIYNALAAATITLTSDLEVVYNAIPLEQTILFAKVTTSGGSIGSVSLAEAEVIDAVGRKFWRDPVDTTLPAVGVSRTGDLVLKKDDKGIYYFNGTSWENILNISAQWKPSVANYASLPSVGSSTDGDAVVVRDENLIYTLDPADSKWRPISSWLPPVANEGDLPILGSAIPPKTNDLRLVVDEREVHTHGGDGDWHPLNQWRTPKTKAQIDILTGSNGDARVATDEGEIYVRYSSSWKKIGANGTYLTVGNTTGDYIGSTQAPVQDAIGALPSTGGRIVIKRGTYTFDLPVSISKPNVTIEAETPGSVNIIASSPITTLFSVSAVNFRMYGIKLDLTDSTYTSTTGAILFGGASSSETEGGEIIDCVFDKPYIAINLNHTSCNNSLPIIIQRCQFKDVQSTSGAVVIKASFTRGVIISECDFYSNISGIKFISCYQSKIINNIAHGTTSNNGTYFIHGDNCYNIEVDGNDIYNTDSTVKSSGSIYFTKGTISPICYGISITNNKIKVNTGGCAQIEIYGNGLDDEGFNISENELYGVSTRGIKINACKRAIISNNYIACGKTNSIDITNSNNILINDNILKPENNSGTKGISIDSYSYNVIASNNSINLSIGKGIECYADHSIISNNTIIDNTESAIYMGSDGYYIVSNNKIRTTASTESLVVLESSGGDIYAVTVSGNNITSDITVGTGIYGIYAPGDLYNSLINNNIFNLSSTSGNFEAAISCNNIITTCINKNTTKGSDLNYGIRILNSTGGLIYRSSISENIINFTTLEGIIFSDIYASSINFNDICGYSSDQYGIAMLEDGTHSILYGKEATLIGNKINNYAHGGMYLLIETDAIISQNTIYTFSRDTTPSGRGIYIMQKFSEAMYFNHQGNEVMLFFSFQKV